jgi:hypothetical protein
LVSFIQLFQPSAGIFITSIAKTGFGFCQHAAVADDALPDISRFVFIHVSASVTMVFLSQIAQACPAIHAAGGNKALVEASLC